MATPSLALIPSGYKSQKVYSVLPSNGDGDFTFSRASSAIRVNKDGLIEEVNSNVPRLDYSDGSCPSLLLENQSTNLFPYSDASIGFTKTNVTISNNQGTSPDGANNATKMLMSSGTGTHRVYEGISSSLDDNNTFSVFIKEQSEVSHIGLNADTTSGVAWFSGSDGSIINANGLDAKTQSLANGWHRISISYVADANDGGDNQFVKFSNRENTSPNPAFNGTETVLMYGFQAEKQSYPTSYISTNGAIATRVAETCTDAGNSDTFNSEEGALFYKALFGEEHSDSRYISISDSSSSNRVIIGVTGGSSVLRAFLFSGGVEQAQITETIDLSQTIKVCISYKQNEIKFYKNGFLVGEDTSATTPVGLSKLSFNAYPSSANFYGKAKEVRVYNEALTDAELQELTS